MSAFVASGQTVKVYVYVAQINLQDRDNLPALMSPLFRGSTVHVFRSYMPITFRAGTNSFGWTNKVGISKVKR